jgi:cephalosporin hydroxylase
MEAVVEFLAAHPEFANDAGREKHLLTFNPRGYLRRSPE